MGSPGADRVGVQIDDQLFGRISASALAEPDNPPSSVKLTENVRCDAGAADGICTPRFEISVIVEFAATRGMLVKTPLAATPSLS